VIYLEDIVYPGGYKTQALYEAFMVGGAMNWGGRTGSLSLIKII
jgi:hypothetical protein